MLQHIAVPLQLRGRQLLELSCLPGLQKAKGGFHQASAWGVEGGSRGHPGKGLPHLENQREDQEVGFGKSWGEVTHVAAGLPGSSIQPSLLWEGLVPRLGGVL